MAMETGVTGGAAANPLADTPSDASPIDLSTPAVSVSRLPKKQLLSCGIEAHTIQKCSSPKKKALDPLRYMPERASYHTLFTLVACFEDHAGEYHALRSYQQFRTLHSQLQKKFPKSKLPKGLPSLHKKRFDNQYIEDKTKELNAYLTQLIELAEVRHSKILRDFLEECPQSEESDDDDAVPTKMLDGLPGTIVSVRAGQSFSVSLRLQRAGDVASWQFTTKKHNIGFSATFNGENVRVYSREDSHVKPVKGSFKCPDAGTLTLDWDNTHTWSKTKVLVYWAEVEQARKLSLHELPGYGSSRGPASPVADATPMVDSRRSGYIAQSRNPSLYPRQIMNTSLSLITKPFIWGRHDQNAQFKSGSLIVERNVKFRGRNWYRKWFVLDTCKCVLRYYDSEQASRKGLSLAKMSLATKNACLAITSQDEAAPTPYLFMVRARKRYWKLCASSQGEYNEWEHAISTAILTSQLKRRNQRMKTVTRDHKGGDDNAHEQDALDDDDSEDDDDDDDDDDEEEDGEDGGKDDEDDTDDDENDSDQAPPRHSTLSMASMSSLAAESTTTLAMSGDRDVAPMGRTSIATRTVATPMLVSLCFCEHWLGQLRSASRPKRLLAVLWINCLVFTCRSSTIDLVASTILVANAYAVAHALDNPRWRGVAKDTHV